MLEIEFKNEEFYNYWATIAYMTKYIKFNTHIRVLAWCMENQENGKVIKDTLKMSRDLEISSSNAYISLRKLKDLGILDDDLCFNDQIKESLETTIRPEEETLKLQINVNLN